MALLYIQKIKVMKLITRYTAIIGLVCYGIGFHHAGVNINDRKIIEQLFKSRHLHVLTATSTLAVGVCKLLLNFDNVII